MSECYLGEIRMFAGAYAPEGWMLCNGQLLSIAGNQALYTLLGTVYGGDGVTTFALPDLRGRVPLHKVANYQSMNYPLGNQIGVEAVTLTTSQMPAHTHVAMAQSGPGNSSTPLNNYWAATAATNIYAPASGTALGSMAPTDIVSAGGSQPHENMMPYLCISYIISTIGIFPTQN
ncbi:phage tail protein [Duganella sp. FT27W]|uniref:phage tail protein n=1 Tax=Duganella sp. FT27W TaxID=2654636 RepID=UPI00128E41E2|nr:tail fiber protein [Duganella sp. FT27W]MPQ56784.1 phage tail protein [Duganella sp. FT27W]